MGWASPLPRPVWATWLCLKVASRTASQALRHSSALKNRFLAARTLVEAGDIDKALPLVDGLASERGAEPRAHARILEGVIALKNGDAPEAMSLLQEANKLFDTWIGFFDLGTHVSE